MTTYFPAEKDISRASPEEREYYKHIENYFVDGGDTVVDKLATFAKYVSRQDITKFLARYEIFKKILYVHGSIVECGVFKGQGLFTMAKISSILEPINHQRRIIGFDTFEGFPELDVKDELSTSPLCAKGKLKSDSYMDIMKGCELYNADRALGHIPKIDVIKGNARKTIPLFLRENPHFLISLLYLDFDIYEPTLVALRNFLPRMHKGSIVVFDELNSKSFTGETEAFLEMDLHLELKRFPFEPNICYGVL